MLFTDWSRICLQNRLTRAMSSEMVISMKLSCGLAACLVLLICVSIVSSDEVKSFDFDVKPGGARNHYETEQWVCLSNLHFHL